MMQIEESGMSFIVDERHCYHVEASESYKDLSTRGVEICEYIELKEGDDKSIVFVEAKMSSPNPQSKLEGATEKFEDYIKSICNKFINAANLLNAGVFCRRPDVRGEIPASFTQEKLQKSEYKCILVIKNHEKSWLIPVQDALNREFSRNPFWNIWSNVKVKVINESIARSKNIIK